MAFNTPKKPTTNSPYKGGSNRSSSSQLGVGTGVPPGGGDAAPKPGNGIGGGSKSLNFNKSNSLTSGGPKGASPKGQPEGSMTTPQFQGDHPDAQPYNGPLMKVEGGSFVPQINIDSMPELDTEVTIEFALEQFARVMIEWVEQQDDINVQASLLAMAQEWHSLAATLLQHRVDMESTRGEVELKQQQLVHNDMDHQQKFAQQDQMHQQNLKHQDAMNQMNMQHQDQMNKMGMQNTQMQNQMGIQAKQQMMKQQTQFGDQKNKMALQQQKDIHQNKMSFTKQQQQARMQQMKQRATQSKKPSPKK